MRSTISIEDGVIQTVLTPESEYERNLVNMLQSKPLSVRVFESEFYDCVGGWSRFKEGKSLIIRCETEERNIDHRPRCSHTNDA